MPEPTISTPNRGSGGASAARSEADYSNVFSGWTVRRIAMSVLPSNTSIR